ncbi:hypothetical protein BDN71DRAFT_1434306 [Pleurotus eryngii]|uniref:CxC2-like cysteine cluster KDZ transposase-associated domain-containing protein n=1 Tax=Pleurotus eryngii TaxID=5323 RepID=A0A9P6DBR2_PLEER|nr:hypothetical protein BDN71DRAFT_1434306 [Pleurotus eryngii]
MCVIIDHSNTNQRCEWLKHKADEQIRLQATCNSQDEGKDEVEEVEDTYRDQRADADVTIEQCDGGVEERFDIDEIIEEVEKEEARHAHSGEEDLDGANKEDEEKAGLSEALIDHLITSSMDPDQNPYVLFVHMNGLHSLPYIQCGCGSLQERITGAVQMQLMLASFTIFKTMFTFDVLEDFCLANLECVNLPDNWKEDENKWVYLQMLMADRNFKADHIRQSTGDKDVWLLPGSSMLPHHEEYTEFLWAAENIKTHECFAPGSVANLYRGKQQKNVNWVLLQSLKYFNMDPEQGLLFFYDIACEILESLWANFNAVTLVMRTATLTHQAEMLDDHICDSNHKKALNIADAEDTRDEITERVGAKNITAWTDAIVEAENTHYIDLSMMDIYGMSASYEDHLAVPAEDEPLNGEYQWIREAIEVQELQWHVLCQAKPALKNGQADEVRQIANLQEKISKSISDITLQSHVLGIEGSNIRNIDPPASMTGTKPLPGDSLFSNLNDFEPPDNDIDVDDKESSDEADVPTVLTAAIAFPLLAEHPTTADDTILHKFKELSKADIKSNTYVVNPNQPGSTTLNLSWIWHVGRDDESALATLQKSNHVLYLKSHTLTSHWQKELLLVKYEMEWTVRYFKHNHDIWVDRSSDSSPGATAYV